MRNRVKELRIKRNISQLCLAMKVGCAQNTISKIEMGNTEPRGELLLELSKYFNVSIDYILYNSEAKHTQEMQKTATEVENGYSHFFDMFGELTDMNKETLCILIERLASIEEKDRGLRI